MYVHHLGFLFRWFLISKINVALQLTKLWLKKVTTSYYYFSNSVKSVSVIGKLVGKCVYPGMQTAWKHNAYSSIERTLETIKELRQEKTASSSFNLIRFI